LRFQRDPLAPDPRYPPISPTATPWTSSTDPFSIFAPRVTKLVAQRLQRPAEQVAARLQAFNGVAQNTLGLDFFEVEEGIATAAL
jgi:hypothetical protein